MKQCPTAIQNDDLKSAVSALRSAEQILVISHMVPDGDSVGALLALGLGLLQIGKKVQMCTPDRVPEIYHFLEGQELIIQPTSIMTIPELVVMIDCTDFDRIGVVLSQRIMNHTAVINLDHHISNRRFGTINYIDTKAAASAEIIYQIIIDLGVQIDQAIANALYTGIITDTGSFQFSNTTPQSFRIAAFLIEAGADLDLIREKLYESQPISMIRLLGVLLSQMEITAQGQIAWMAVDQNLLAAHAIESDTGWFEGLINYPRSVEGVELAILFREIAPQVIKVGFRSKTTMDVNQLAGRLGGGGHRKASGCVLLGSLEEVSKKVLAVAMTGIEEWRESEAAK